MQGAIEKDFLNLLSVHCTTEKGVRQYTLFLRAIGAAGAQLPYKQKVTSSNLVSPTIYFRALYNARFLFNGFSLLRTRSVRNNKPSAMRMENNLLYKTTLSLDSDDCSGRHNIPDQRG